ncbi:uncharacterized protein LOC135331347 isoform X2 [Halichondria panicea]|uniref:uncharacterized protein LOC135331347 isoform X2 n=1 Tax=Halichondria panicea TaxID=6063 RepID=UPI00312B6CC6
MSSSSPEQSLTPPTSDRTIPHNASACSVTSIHSDVAGIMESSLSPPSHTLSSHLRTSLPNTLSPSSPQLASRGSTGKLQRGVMKLLRLPQTPNTVHHHPTLREDPLEQSVTSKEALFMRMLRGSRKIRSFRRSKRRGIDKQYHSDDGYTSDPGLLREDSLLHDVEDDDETDGGDVHVDENRRQQQIRNLERKIEKIRGSLHEEDLVHGSEQDLVSLPELDDKPHDDKPHRSRLHRPSLKNYSRRKKLENWETQLRLLQEGAPLESKYAALRERIGGGLRGMSLGLKGRLTFNKRSKRFNGSNADGVIDDDEDDEALDDISQATEGVIHMEADEFPTETELLPMLKLKEDMDVVRQTSEEALQESHTVRKELDMHKTRLEELEQCVNTIYNKLELEKERSERLEGQVNDITELHQHEVGELRAQIGQMESMSMSKNQDLEDNMEACQSKLERLDVFVHRLIDSGDEPTSTIRKPVTTLISLVLIVFTVVIKLGNFFKTKIGLMSLAVLLIAVLLVIVFYR